MNVRERMEELYGDKIMRRSAARNGADVFEQVLSGKGYRTVLEIGTFRGCSAAVMAQYVEKVITIDLRYGKMEQNGELIDRFKFWKSLGLNNIAMWRIADDREKARVIEGLEFDFAFIDGAHDANGVKTDFELTKRCGRVLFHDVVDNGAINHVGHLLMTLPPRQVQMLGDFALWMA